MGTFFNATRSERVYLNFASAKANSDGKTEFTWHRMPYKQDFLALMMIKQGILGALQKEEP